MADGVERIVIVGGGTAGWMSAAFLEKALSGASRRKIVITLVESDDIDMIGIAEATIPSITKMLATIGVPEWRLLSEADATFKNAIKFVGWGGPPDAGGLPYFYHPLDPPLIAEGHNAMIHWLALKDAGMVVEPLHDATSIGAALCDANLSPKLFQSAPYEAPVPYAYHLDAVKLGRLLRSIATERGVERIVDHVDHVDRGADGDIVALRTRDGRTIAGDLFIDCSGFDALLIEKSLGEPFVSYNDRLLCDRAIACQMPLDEDAPSPRVYTTATAQRAGWTWEIDLPKRRSAGHVYSSAFISDEDAERTLIDHIGAQSHAVKPSHIAMRIGRRENMWVGNCISIGPSAGYLEPLESTGIHLIELGLMLLIDHLGEGPAMAPQRAQYNKILRATFDEVADFLVMHYAFNGRRGEPFWDHYRNAVALPPSLIAKLQLWAYKMPSRTDLTSPVNVFDGFSYFAVMAGLNTLPPYGGGLSPFIDLKASAAVLDHVKEQQKLGCRLSPKHGEILKKIRSTAGG